MVVHENPQDPNSHIRDLTKSVAELHNAVNALNGRTELTEAAITSGREAIKQTIKSSADAIKESVEDSRGGCLSTCLYVAALICVVFTWYNTHTLSATDKAIAERLTLPESEVLSKDRVILKKMSEHKPLTHEEYIWEAARQRIADTMSRGLKFAEDSKQVR